MFSCLVCCFALLGQTPPQAVPPADAELIAKLVRQLADDDFDTRQKASARLWEIGLDAEPALRAAVKESDSELVARATEILAKFDRGQFGGIPEKFQSKLESFWPGEEKPPVDRRTLAKDLAPVLPESVLLKLIEIEKEQDVRSIVADQIVGRAKRYRELLLTRDPRIEAILAARSINGSSLRMDYIEYLAITGQLEQKLAAPSIEESASRGQMLVAQSALMYRAKGDLRRALEQLTNGDSNLRSAFLIESGQWQEVLKIPIPPKVSDSVANAGKDAAKRPSGPMFGVIPSGDSKSLSVAAYRAMLHRMAGNAGNLGELLTAIRKVAETENSADFAVAEALILNEDIDGGLKILRDKKHAATLFVMLNAQNRPADALDAIGYSNSVQDPANWYSDLLKDSDRIKEKSAPGLAVEVAEKLYLMGRIDQAAGLFNAVAGSEAPEAKAYRISIARREMELGLRKQGLDHALLCTEPNDSREMHRAILPEISLAWAQWWKNRHPDSSDRQMLEGLYELFHPAFDRRLKLEELQTLCDDLTTFFKDLPDHDRAAALTAVGVVCRRHDQTKLSVSYLIKSTELQPSSKNLFDVGCRLCIDGDYRRANELFTRSWEKDPAASILLYMQGFAQARSRAGEAGQSKMVAATLLGVGSASARNTLADNLDRLGLHHAAAQQYDFLVRCGSPNELSRFAAARYVADSLAFSDPDRAVLLYQLDSLRVLPGRDRMKSLPHFALPNAIHKAQARSALVAKKFAAVTSHLKLAQQFLPGDVSLVEEFVPAMKAAGKTNDADELLAACRQFLRQQVENYPNAATYHHELAWMLARTDTDLAEAEKSARRAIELQPEAALHFDTLAEVRFHQGALDDALQAAREAIHRAPRSKDQQQRLARFEALANHAEKVPPDPAIVGYRWKNQDDEVSESSSSTP